jgi:hypothetical protein
VKKVSGLWLLLPDVLDVLLEAVLAEWTSTTSAGISRRCRGGGGA